MSESASPLNAAAPAACPFAASSCVTAPEGTALPPNQATPATAMPGPPPAGLRTFWKMRHNYLGLTQSLHARYGDATCMRVGHETLYEFFHPDWVRAILVDHAAHLVRWEPGPRVFGELMGNSVLLSDGAVWQRQRRILQPGFGTRRMPGYASLMVHTADTLLQQWHTQAQRTSDAAQDMTQLTMAVILKTLFGASAQCDVLRTSRAVNYLGNKAYKLLFLPFRVPDWLPQQWRKVWEVRRLKNLIKAQLNERQAVLRAGAAPQDDLLGVMLAARDEQGDGQGLSDAEILDQCMTIFMAGHDTTASALTWWLWAMVSHPECAARARAEVDAVLGQNLPTYENIAALPYLGQTLREALRIYPPAPFLLTRRTTQALQIGPWTVPKGGLIRITPYVLHHDARWFPEPERFLPERFAPQAAAQIPRGAYMPFGNGPRVCIGNTFATTEMTLIAAMLLQRFTFERPADSPAPQPVQGIVLHTAKGLRLRWRARP